MKVNILNTNYSKIYFLSKLLCTLFSELFDKTSHLIFTIFIVNISFFISNKYIV